MRQPPVSCLLNTKPFGGREAVPRVEDGGFAACSSSGLAEGAAGARFQSQAPGSVSAWVRAGRRVWSPNDHPRPGACSKSQRGMTRRRSNWSVIPPPMSRAWWLSLTRARPGQIFFAPGLSASWRVGEILCGACWLIFFFFPSGEEGGDRFCRFFRMERRHLAAAPVRGGPRRACDVAWGRPGKVTSMIYRVGESRGIAPALLRAGWSGGEGRSSATAGSAGPQGPCPEDRPSRMRAAHSGGISIRRGRWQSVGRGRRTDRQRVAIKPQRCGRGDRPRSRMYCASCRARQPPAAVAARGRPGGVARRAKRLVARDHVVPCGRKGMFRRKPVAGQVGAQAGFCGKVARKGPHGCADCRW